MCGVGVWGGGVGVGGEEDLLEVEHEADHLPAMRDAWVLVRTHQEPGRGRGRGGVRVRVRLGLGSGLGLGGGVGLGLRLASVT